MKQHIPDLVSVIVPVYNAGAWLSECVQSIVRQQYSNLQIILVNDGSRDISEDICLKWVEQDTRVRYIYQVNSGVSIARNRGIAEAKGEFICFVDSDDWIEENHISELLAALKTDKADMATVGYTKVNTTDFTLAHYFPPATQRIPLHAPEGEESLVNLFESRLLYSPVAHLFKAEIIDKHNIRYMEGIHFGEDRLFLLDYLSHCTSITTIATSTYKYRIENPSSLSNIKPETVLQSEQLFFERNKRFIDNLGFVKTKTQQWLYTSVFNAFIDDFFLNTGLTWLQAIRKASWLTSSPLFRQGLKKADTSTYSPFLLFLFKFKMNILLSILLKIKQ